MNHQIATGVCPAQEKNLDADPAEVNNFAIGLHGRHTVTKAHDCLGCRMNNPLNTWWKNRISASVITMIRADYVPLERFVRDAADFFEHCAGSTGVALTISEQHSISSNDKE